MKILEKYIASICAFSLSVICLVGFILSLNPKFAFSAFGFGLFGYSFLPLNGTFSNLGLTSQTNNEANNQNNNHSMITQILGSFCIGAGMVGIFDNVS